MGRLAVGLACACLVALCLAIGKPAVAIASAFAAGLFVSRRRS